MRYVIRELNGQKEHRLKKNDQIQQNNGKQCKAKQEEEQAKLDQLKHLGEKIKQMELELMKEEAKDVKEELKDMKKGDPYGSMGSIVEFILKGGKNI
uniref:Uncharacterized protein n=1 Tax=Globodera rostochiensis TaxID=31243 RepID=A0A914HD36_GLORO